MQKQNEQSSEVFLTSLKNHLQLANHYLMQNNAKLAAAQIQKARYLLENLKKYSN